MNSGNQYKNPLHIQSGQCPGVNTILVSMRPYHVLIFHHDMDRFLWSNTVYIWDILHNLWIVGTSHTTFLIFNLASICYIHNMGVYAPVSDIIISPWWFISSNPMQFVYGICCIILVDWVLKYLNVILMSQIDIMIFRVMNRCLWCNRCHIVYRRLGALVRY